MVEVLRRRLGVVQAKEAWTDAEFEHLARDGGGLVVSAGGSVREMLELSQRAARWQLTHLPVLLEWGGVCALVGPREEPGVPGCFRCMLTRQSEGGLFSLMEEPRPPRHPPVSPPGWHTALAVLVAQQAAGRAGTVYELERRTLKVTRRSLLPVGRCTCGAPLRRAEQGERFTAPADFQRRPLSVWQGVDRWVDERWGPILNTRRELAPAHFWPTVTAQAAVSNTKMRVFGVGRSASFRSSHSIALLEALERYQGLVDRTGRPRVEASLKELGEEALDPHRLGLYTPEQYALPGFPCRPFEETSPLEWVRGWSVTHRRPLWIPAEVVFYGETLRPKLVLETSNGCSLGASPEEALLFGLLELIERDAALRLWYQAYAAPRLDLAEGLSRTALLLRERMHRMGYELLAFDATSELELPVALVMALRSSGEGAAALCASGAHLRMEGAVERALSELASMAAWGAVLSHEEQARAELLAREPGQVRTLDDHLLAMAAPSAREHLSFLLEAPRTTRSCAGYVSPAVTLVEMVRRLGVSGFELIAVEQTAPELRELGLHCVRAVVPGLIPIHYGEFLRRAVPRDRGGARGSGRPPHPFT
jgi:ribosomal protein S12 methylthiotransferase accessory factor